MSAIVPFRVISSDDAPSISLKFGNVNGAWRHLWELAIA